MRRLPRGQQHTRVWYHITDCGPARRSAAEVSMAKAAAQPTYEEAVEWLRANGFDILEAPGTASRIFVKKYNCSAAIERDPAGNVKLFARPGCLISGEIAKLVDKG